MISRLMHTDLQNRKNNTVNDQKIIKVQMFILMKQNYGNINIHVLNVEYGIYMNYQNKI